MQEREQGASARRMESTSNTTIGARWGNWRYLAILVLLTLGIRGWQLTHTEVASRDSISFIRIAWQLEHGSWREVLPLSPQHPGYPLAVLGASLPVRHYFPDDLPRAWQVSAQLVSALASVLLVFPMYYLGRELFDRRTSFWACLMFQCLPTSGKIMGDGLSDTLFVLFACSCLCLTYVALRKKSWPYFSLTGLTGGLAYLTRPEGALLVAVTGLVLLATQFHRRWRTTWPGFLANGAALTLTMIVVMSPYVFVIRGLTVKNTPNLMINQQRPDADWEGRLRPQPKQQSELRAPTLPSSTLFADFWGPGAADFDASADKITDLSQLQNMKPPARYRWALKATSFEMGKGFFYVAWIPALLGLWWYRDRFLLVPGTWVGLFVCLILWGLLFRMAEKMGYISDRHFLLIILSGTFWAAAGCMHLGEILARGAARLWPTLANRRWMRGTVWSVGLLLLLTAAPLPRTLARLHSERAGFRSVGQWLAQNADPGAYVEDPYCWAYYYAGRVFQEGIAGIPMIQSECYYVVLENSTNRHPRLFPLQLAREHILKEKAAKIIHSENIPRGKEKVTLQVWQVPVPFQWQPPGALPGQRN